MKLGIALYRSMLTTDNFRFARQPVARVDRLPYFPDARVPGSHGAIESERVMMQNIRGNGVFRMACSSSNKGVWRLSRSRERGIVGLACSRVSRNDE